MDRNTENELLLLHNRIRKFSESLIKDERLIYKDAGIDIPVRYIRVLHILDHAVKPLSISEIAKSIDRTHSDIHYISIGLYKEGLVVNVKDKSDNRRRLIKLSDKGIKTVNKIKPIWKATIEATSEWITDLAPEFLISMNSLHESLAKQSFYQRIQQKLKQNFESTIQLSTFKKLPREEELILAFYENWSREFLPVPELRNALENISRNIIKQGGEVFFAQEQEETIGLATIQRLSFERSQLLFIYVLPRSRRKYVGNRLMKECISFAERIGCKQIICHTNKMLVPMEHLLAKYDFEFSRLAQKNYASYDNLQHTMVLKIK